MQISLAGRTALVTGGSDGLGLATAMRFAQSGASVIILARDEERLRKAAERIRASADVRVEARVCDVRNAGQIATTHAAIRDAGMQVDILVNNAGYHLSGTFEELGDDKWQEDIDLKLMAAVRLSRAVFPGMKERRWGRIINILNVFAKAPQPGTAPTCVTRAATLALGKALAAEGAPYNVLVNALLIGVIRSGQIERMHQKQAPERSFEEFSDAAAKRLGIPIGRIGRAEELASVACFLASDASSYVTGTAINVDGGLCPVT